MSPAQFSEKGQSDLYSTTLLRLELSQDISSVQIIQCQVHNLLAVTLLNFRVVRKT